MGSTMTATQTYRETWQSQPNKYIIKIHSTCSIQLHGLVEWMPCDSDISLANTSLDLVAVPRLQAFIKYVLFCLQSLTQGCHKKINKWFEMQTILKLDVKIFACD